MKRQTLALVALVALALFLVSGCDLTSFGGASEKVTCTVTIPESALTARATDPDDTGPMAEATSDTADGVRALRANVIIVNNVYGSGQTAKTASEFSPDVGYNAGAGTLTEAAASTAGKVFSAKNSANNSADKTEPPNAEKETSTEEKTTADATPETAAE